MIDLNKGLNDWWYMNNNRHISLMASCAYINNWQCAREYLINRNEKRRVQRPFSSLSFYLWINNDTSCPSIIELSRMSFYFIFFFARDTRQCNFQLDCEIYVFQSVDGAFNIGLCLYNLKFRESSLDLIHETERIGRNKTRANFHLSDLLMITKLYF